MTYCCTRFEEAVRYSEIVRAESEDETEWFIPELWHLYFCPFCGASIKGKGWGSVPT